jgi:hypothetical protein
LFVLDFYREQISAHESRCRARDQAASPAIVQQT